MGNNTTSYDKNLNPVLETASDEDLQFLVDLILNKMSNYLDINEAYKKYAPVKKHNTVNTFVIKVFFFSTNTYTSNISLPPNLFGIIA